MTIRRKMNFGIGIPLVIFLVFSVIFYTQIRLLGRNIKQVTEVEAPKCRAVLNMKSELAGIGFDLVGYLNNSRAEEVESMEQYKKEFRVNQGIYCQLTTDKQDEMLAVTIDKNIAILWKMIEELVNLHNYQRQRLSKFHEILEEVERISEDGLKSCSESPEIHTFDGLRPFMEMRIWGEDVEEDIHCYLKRHQKKCRDKIYQDQENFSRVFNGYEGPDSVLSKDQWLGQVCSIQGEVASLVDDIITLEDRKESRLNEFFGKKDGLSTILEAEVDKAHGDFEEASRKSRGTVAVSTAVALVLAFAGLISGFVSQAFMNYTIMQQITVLRDAAAKISEGQYNTRMKIESDDELGQIASSIGKMAEELKGLSASSDLSSGESVRREKAGISS